ncbi:orotidine 5'-phosphate decarboxylase [Roseivivax jejudonensis]|uniref:Orotidine-5'-phosphate decarboxylase n=1 Tax=Roseivivax jejudonensis TaxID=1529041 RepID=A0A1X7A315_9RHOB|nr:orotidine-5'-phosphate decarboxylase [Roseivivax jejudonensis]SLN69151.1 orotidine 5'-phosphate decarboxylase [Roseivivax jejudonensis]
MTDVSRPFAARFADIADRRSAFCFGADPSPAVLRDWGLPADATGLADFVSIVLEAVEAGHVGLLKPQVAFYEAFGPAGMAELARLIAGARNRGLLVIADAKRGDIGTSSAGYGAAWLGRGGFDADAVTLTAYLGLGALSPVFDRAADTGSAAFVVVRSSNPEGAALQSALSGDVAVADRLAAEIEAENARLAPGATGPVGAVIGATLGAEATRTVAAMPSALFLVPGLGAQGGTLEDMARIFVGAEARVIPTASRAILAAGPSVADLRTALARNAEAAMRLRPKA